MWCGVLVLLWECFVGCWVGWLRFEGGVCVLVVFGTVSVHEEGLSAQMCVCCVAAFWHVWRSGVSSCGVWCFGTVVGVFCGVVCGVLVCVWVFGWLKRSNVLLCSWVCVLAIWWCAASSRVVSCFRTVVGEFCGVLCGVCVCFGYLGA